MKFDARAKMSCVGDTMIITVGDDSEVVVHTIHGATEADDGALESQGLWSCVWTALEVTTVCVGVAGVAIGGKSID
jgi:hypothetical protein